MYYDMSYRFMGKMIFWLQKVFFLNAYVYRHTFWLSGDRKNSSILEGKNKSYS